MGVTYPVWWVSYNLRAWVRISSVLLCCRYLPPKISNTHNAKRMANNTNLGAAKAAKNDEFYTQYADIQKEIDALKAKFERTGDKRNGGKSDGK